MKANTHIDFDRNRLSEHFVYESFDSANHLFFNRGSVGFVLKGWPLVGASLQAQNEISEFLKEEDNLPQGAAFQVAMVGTSFLEGYLNHWESVRVGEIFKQLAKRRVDALRKKAVEAGVLKDIFLLISVTIPTKTITTDFIADMERRRDTLKSTLRSIGLHADDLSSADLLQTLRLFFGWDSESHPAINPYELLSEQILPGDFQMEVEADKLLVHQETDDFALVAIEVAKRPKYWKLAEMDLFLGNEMRRGEQIRSDFIQSFSLQILPQQAVQTSVAMGKRESLLKNMRSGFLKWMPNLEEEYEDMDAAVLSLQQGDRMVILQQNMILKDRLDKIKARTHEYRSMMRRNGFYFVPCVADHLPVILSALPMQGVEQL